MVCSAALLRPHALNHNAVGASLAAAPLLPPLSPPLLDDLIAGTGLGEPGRPTLPAVLKQRALTPSSLTALRLNYMKFARCWHCLTRWAESD